MNFKRIQKPFTLSTKFEVIREYFHQIQKARFKCLHYLHNVMQKYLPPLNFSTLSTSPGKSSVKPCICFYAVLEFVPLVYFVLRTSKRSPSTKFRHYITFKLRLTEDFQKICNLKKKKRRRRELSSHNSDIT